MKKSFEMRKAIARLKMALVADLGSSIKLHVFAILLANGTV
jgi:hypothetical protein